MEEFYSILGRADEAGATTFEVMINKEHRVFEGHFPGNPVVPGVMTMMMVRELAEQLTNEKTHFAQVGQCKYSAMIVPDGKPIKVRVALKEKTVQADVMSTEGESLMKIKATLA